MTRTEHLEWCKKRAHEYLRQGDVKNAVTSMLSDISKHPDTKLLAGSPIAMLGMMALLNRDYSEAVRFIDGSAQLIEALTLGGDQC